MTQRYEQEHLRHLGRVRHLGVERGAAQEKRERGDPLRADVPQRDREELRVRGGGQGIIPLQCLSDIVTASGHGQKVVTGR